MDHYKRKYEKYLEEFDPSPINYGDDYGTPMDYDTWLYEFLNAPENSRFTARGPQSLDQPWGNFI